MRALDGNSRFCPIPLADQEGLAFTWTPLAITPSGHVMADHTPRVLETLSEIQRDGSFETRVQLAVAAPDVLLGAVVLPVGGLVELLESLVMPVGYQVAGTLPSLRIAGDGCPRAAQQVAVTHQIVKVNRGIYDLVII